LTGSLSWCRDGAEVGIFDDVTVAQLALLLRHDRHVQLVKHGTDGRVCGERGDSQVSML
jgi:hypothetical protein